MLKRVLLSKCLEMGDITELKLDNQLFFFFDLYTQNEVLFCLYKKLASAILKKSEFFIYYFESQMELSR